VPTRLIKLIGAFPEVASIKCNEGGEFALHLSCKFFISDRVIRKLIEIYPMALQERNDNGEYHIHCTQRFFYQNDEVFKLLLDADPLTMQRQNRYGTSALHLAFCYHDGYNIHLLEYMVQHANNGVINIRTSSGDTPLHIACSNNNEKDVEVILKHPDVNPNASDRLNQAPLHKIFIGCNKTHTVPNFCDVVTKLLDHPVIVINPKNNDNKTPLDLIKNEIRRIEHHCYADSINIERERNNLLEWKAAKELLEEFLSKRRLDAYQFLLSYVMEI
jgi:ankyrin repeat protein